jgi:DNA-binding IclR family transcriptional regulator
MSSGCMNVKIETKIINALRKSPMHISDIARETGLNRLTVSKYCAVLETAGKIKQTDMAQLKIFFINSELKANEK